MPVISEQERKAAKERLLDAGCKYMDLPHLRDQLARTLNIIEENIYGRSYTAQDYLGDMDKMTKFYLAQAP